MVDVICITLRDFINNDIFDLIDNGKQFSCDEKEIAFYHLDAIQKNLRFIKNKYSESYSKFGDLFIVKLGDDFVARLKYFNERVNDIFWRITTRQNDNQCIIETLQDIAYNSFTLRVAVLYADNIVDVFEDAMI